MDNTAATPSGITEVLETDGAGSDSLTPKLDADGADAPRQQELHLRSGDEDVDIVRTTMKVRWTMQRC